MASNIRRYELSDNEWTRLKPYFEGEAQKKGRPRRDAWELLNAILWIARSGAAWRDLPERYGAWQTAYKRFVQWQESGLLEKVFHELSTDAGEAVLDPPLVVGRAAALRQRHGLAFLGQVQPDARKAAFREQRGISLRIDRLLLVNESADHVFILQS